MEPRSLLQKSLENVCASLSSYQQQKLHDVLLEKELEPIS